MILRRLALILALVCAAPQTAAAWDPSTTHLGMIDRAVQASALHLRWMAGSELQRGLFSPLRVDPARLTAPERRFLGEALQRSHSGSGVQPLGGPGACPGAKAPPTTQLYCVEGDVWEMPAVQWIHLGAIAELVPSARAVHHFVDRKDAAAKSFDDPQQRPLLLRARQFRSNGAPLAGYVTGTSFAGTGPSALAWLGDTSDPLAPLQTYRHLELASTLPDARGRDHHLAMALIGLGAVLHVLQDMSVPAHARGDVTAFFSDLSSAAGDRGLPFSEIARLSFRRHDLPTATAIGSRGVPLAGSLQAHFLGDSAYEGLAVFTGRRFLSERSVPAPQYLEHGLGPAQAAAVLLAGAELEASEVQGAELSPWPGVRGYLKTSTGRPLAAYDTDAEGRVRCYIDEAVYREQFSQLVPRSVDASRSLIDWLFPSWPELTYDAAAGHVDFAVDPALQDAEILVFTQDPIGARTIRQRYRVRPGQRSRITGLDKPTADLRTVLILRAKRPGGEPLLIEHVLGAESKTYPVIDGPDLRPPPPPPPAPELPPADATGDAATDVATDAPADPPTDAATDAPAASEPADPTASDPAAREPTDTLLDPSAPSSPSKNYSLERPTRLRLPTADAPAEPAPKASPAAKPKTKSAKQPTSEPTPTDPVSKASPDAKPKPPEPAPKASPDAKPKPPEPAPKASPDAKPKPTEPAPKASPPANPVKP